MPPLEPLKLMKALNSNLLKDDIRVLSASFTAPSFHARFSARERKYTYILRPNCILAPPLDRYRAWCLPDSLDIEAMKVSRSSASHPFRVLFPLRFSVCVFLCVRFCSLPVSVPTLPYLAFPLSSFFVQEAALRFEGEHDFTSFRNPECQVTFGSFHSSRCLFLLPRCPLLILYHRLSHFR